MTAINDITGPVFTTSESPIHERRVDSSVDDAVRGRIQACPYRFVFGKVTWQFDDGTLTLRGCVPSFYLKQVLQELFRNVEQIDLIVNDVDVVSSNGLSSDRPSKPR